MAALVAVRFALRPLVGDASPFLLFTPAVMLAAWYGGLWPGLLATTLSALVGTLFLLSGGRVVTLEDLDRLALFLVVGAAVTCLQAELAAAAQRIKALLASERAARGEAEAANRAKDDFLAMVSHELRSPLTVISGWSSMLEEHPLDAASVRKAAEVIKRNATLQQRLVEDLLDSVRISRGTMRLQRQRIDLAGVVTAAADASRPAALERGVSVRVDVQVGEITIWGDPARLQQVLMNLLGNATKFTPRGGSIEVRLERRQDQARVTVSDTGAGIDPRFLPHVFEAFRKGEHSPGLGLGLSIVRDLVGMHGGTITATSAGAGQGSCFVLAFPLLAEPVARPAMSHAEPFRASL